jgi:hypothetical protein
LLSAPLHWTSPETVHRSGAFIEAVMKSAKASAKERGDHFCGYLILSFKAVMGDAFAAAIAA